MNAVDDVIAQVLRALGDALVGDPVERDLQAVFEREVQRVANMRAVRLREIPSRYHARLVARQIHEVSRRRGGPFVAVNCAALVETLLEAELFGIEERTATGVRGRQGKFEHAEGGTLFLDEISDLSLSAQAKLLRAIQDVAVERVGGHGSRPLHTRKRPPAEPSLSRHLGRRALPIGTYFPGGGGGNYLPPPPAAP